MDLAVARCVEASSMSAFAFDGSRMRFTRYCFFTFADKTTSVKPSTG